MEKIVIICSADLWSKPFAGTLWNGWSVCHGGNPSCSHCCSDSGWDRICYECAGGSVFPDNRLYLYLRNRYHLYRHVQCNRWNVPRTGRFEDTACNCVWNYFERVVCGLLWEKEKKSIKWLEKLSKCIKIIGEQIKKWDLRNEYKTGKRRN